MRMTEEEKESVRKRAAPVLLLLLEAGKHQLALKNLALALLKPSFDKRDADEAYDMLFDETRRYAKDMAVAVERINRMLFIERGGNPNDWDPLQFQMRQNARRRRTA
jgi:hypothetical protein